MIAYHELSDDHLAALASGLGGPAVVRQLASVQYSKHLLLLRYLAGECADRELCEVAIDVLARSQRQDPHSITDLITDPVVGAWAAQTGRMLAGTRPGTVAVALAQLGALAAAAAIRAGVDAEVHAYAESGAVTLPTLGSAVLGADGPAVVTVAGGRATVTAGRRTVSVGGDDPRWLALRRMVASDGDLTCSVTIEDGSPYRPRYHAPPADRLPDSEVATWQETFGEAWHLLARYIPDRAAELATGLRSVVPLIMEDDGVARSGTARDAFGALGLTRPGSAAEMAVTFVHEFQHSKLSAVLDVVPLYRPDGGELHFAPWRTDARPTAGLIQGVYAFLAVADTWRALRAAPGLEDLATREFAFVREQVSVGLAALEASAELTPRGRAFATGLRNAVEGLKAARLSRQATAAAIERLDGRRRAWYSHNVDVPSPGRAKR